MKHLKIYEKYYKLEIGDYVICWDYYLRNNDDYKNINDFLKNNVGQIIDITNKLTTGVENYVVQYDNIPYNLNKYTTSFYKSSIPMTSKDILQYSKDKSELEIMINSNKYNL